MSVQPSRGLLQSLVHNVSALLFAEHTNNPSLDEALKERDQILDPVSTLVYLSLLTVMPKGTKLVVANNAITLDKPDMTRPIRRSLQNCSFMDLTSLKRPLRLAHKLLDMSSDDVMDIVATATKGIQCLQESYTALADRQRATVARQVLQLCSHTLCKYAAPEAPGEQQVDDELVAAFGNVWTRGQIHIAAQLLKELGMTFSTTDAGEHKVDWHRAEAITQSIEFFVRSNHIKVCAAVAKVMQSC
jgi:hypothetical protein